MAGPNGEKSPPDASDLWNADDWTFGDDAGELLRIETCAPWDVTDLDRILAPLHRLLDRLCAPSVASADASDCRMDPGAEPDEPGRS